MTILEILSLGFGIAMFLAMAWAAVVSAREGEKRAILRFIILTVLIPLPYVLPVFIAFTFKNAWMIGLDGFTVLGILFLLLPFGRNRKYEDTVPKTRLDERDIMFARQWLPPGSARFDAYYERHPEKKKPDDRFRSKPGILSPKSTYFHPVQFASADASFRTLETFWPYLDSPVAAKRTDVEPEAITRFIKRWAKKLGAVTVGIAEMRDYHYYSHRGRQEEPYGQRIDTFHRYGIVLCVEMDKSMLDTSPRGPAMMETAQQYLEVGHAAVQMARLIKNMGYPARAHIDGNYLVVCPLVARDAGLGEIGRMGLLMTPWLGPRVRLAVVTTDMPLVADTYKHDPGMLDFCAICKKCADNCPVKAIPFDDPKQIDGVMRWRIDQEACFTYWCQAGTDCGRCMAVCPFSHPDRLLHNLIRRGIRNSSVFRRAALFLDDFFYGRISESKAVPGWFDG